MSESRVVVEDAYLDESSSSYILSPIYSRNTKEEIIFINGFLTENKDDYDWHEFISDHVRDKSCYHYRWKAGKLMSLINDAALGTLSLVAKPLVGGAVGELGKLKQVAKAGNKVSKYLPDEINIGSAAKKMVTGKNFSNNVSKSWKEAVENAESAGRELGKYIYNSNKKYILVGHSLGSQVIYNTLRFLDKKDSLDQILSVNLLGGAIQADKYLGLLSRNKSLSVNNYYSKADMVLFFLFNLANINDTASNLGAAGMLLGAAFGALTGGLGMALLAGAAGGVAGSLFGAGLQLFLNNPVGRNIIRSSRARNIRCSYAHNDYVKYFSDIFEGFDYQQRIENATVISAESSKSDIIRQLSHSEGVVFLEEGVYELGELILADLNNLEIKSDGNVIFKDTELTLENCSNLKLEFVNFIAGDEKGKKDQDYFLNLDNSKEISFYGTKLTNQDLKITNSSQVSFIESDLIGESYQLKIASSQLDFQYSNILGPKNAVESKNSNIKFIGSELQGARDFLQSENDKIAIDNTVIKEGYNLFNLNQTEIELSNSLITELARELITATNSKVTLANNTVNKSKQQLIKAAYSKVKLINNLVKSFTGDILTTEHAPELLLEDNRVIDSKKAIVVKSKQDQLRIINNEFEDCEMVLDIRESKDSAIKNNKFTKTNKTAVNILKSKLTLEENSFVENFECIYLEGSKGKIINNSFKDNSNISLKLNNSHCEINSNSFIIFKYKNSSCAVYIYNSKEDNLISQNKFANYYLGIYYCDSNADIKENKFDGNGIGIKASNSLSNIIQNNQFKENKSALRLVINSAAILGEDIKDNHFEANDLNYYSYNSDIKGLDENEEKVLVEDTRELEKKFKRRIKKFYPQMEKIFGQKPLGEDIYYQPDNMKDRLEDHISSYANLDIDEYEDILFLYSRYRNFKEGALITKRYIYSSANNRIRIDKIKDISSSKRYLSFILKSGKEIKVEIDDGHFLKLLLKRSLFNTNPIEDMEEEITNLYQSMGRRPFGSNVSLKGSIDKKKLNNAQKYYARKLKKEDILILGDSTVFGSAKKGFIITKDRFYCHQYSPMQLKSLRAEDKGITSVRINGKKVKYGGSKREGFIGFLNNINALYALNDLFALKVTCPSCKKQVKAKYNKCPKCKLNLMLSIAADSNDPEEIEILVNEGREIETLNKENATPLMIAAKYNQNSEIIAALIDAGAKVDVRDGAGFDPVMYAAINNPNPEVITKLVEAGADINAKI
ncbi:DUF726 domain-containing protein [Orenia marismortui]|uniref:DUF726 domain-containing protein n=1 Tax=Orenia marismortui TaxID=46469 RepID=UPI00036FCE19|nr:DUF726 domain-containing protein [Orenia marismortui]